MPFISYLFSANDVQSKRFGGGDTKVFREMDVEPWYP